MVSCQTRIEENGDLKSVIQYHKESIIHTKIQILVDEELTMAGIVSRLEGLSPLR